MAFALESDESRVKDRIKSVLFHSRESKNAPQDTRTTYTVAVTSKTEQ